MRTLTAILLVGLAILVAFIAAAVDESRPVQVYSGTYGWNDGGSDELQAEFRPTEEGAWKVRFMFRFGGKSATWKGTAKGSLDDGGTISGTVVKMRRTWVFEADVKAGVLRGTHTEIFRNGERYDTGTFEMPRDRQTSELRD